MFRVIKEKEVKTLFASARDESDPVMTIYTGIAEKNHCPSGCEEREEFALVVPKDLKQRAILVYFEKQTETEKDEEPVVKSTTEFRCSYVEVDNR